jgi:hypothetical protein
VLKEELEVGGRRSSPSWLVVGAWAVVAVLAIAFAFPTASWADTHRKAADPFLSLERENRAARRFEARERADALEEATQRAHERERAQLKVDEDIDEHDDLEGDE